MPLRCCPGGLFSGGLLLVALIAATWLSSSQAADDPGAPVAADAAGAANDAAANDAAANDAAADDAQPDEAQPEAAKADGAKANEAAKAGDSHAADEHATGTAGAAGHEAHVEHAGDAGHGDAGHGDAGHGGEDLDLSHANPGPTQQEVIDWKSDLAIFTFAVFFLLLAILGKFAWGPITSGLDKREKAIEGMIAEARENQQKATDLVKAHEAKLAAAAEETRELLAKAHRDAEAARERILAEAEEAGQRQRQRALADIELAKNVALSEVARKGAEIAVDLAGQIVRRELRPEDHVQLIQDSLERFSGNN